MRYGYWTVKLARWRGREAALVEEANPFALIAGIWLGIQAARGREPAVAEVVRAALRALLRRGEDEERIVAALAFLEHVVVLSPQRYHALLDEVLAAEGVAMAQVLSRFERSGLRKGRQEERQEIALRLLAIKFGELDEATVARIQGLRSTTQLALLDALLGFAECADLDHWLATHQSWPTVALWVAAEHFPTQN